MIYSQHLASSGASVTILSRSTDTKAPAGAKVVSVDYASESSLVSAVSNVEVVISTLSGGGFAVQPALAQASKKAGVKLFVPSEFGIDTTLITQGFLLGKKNFHQALRDLGLPYLLVSNGPFLDTVFGRKCHGFFDMLDRLRFDDSF